MYLEAHNTVNQIKTAPENITDPLEIDGLVLRLDYLKAYESYYEGESLIPIQYLKRALEVILQETHSSLLEKLPPNTWHSHWN